MKRSAVLAVLILSLAALGQSQARNPAPAVEDAARFSSATIFDSSLSYSLMRYAHIETTHILRHP